MLSELIVHRGMGGGTNVVSNEKKESLTKQEISDILKYGAENLFADDEEGQGRYLFIACIISCKAIWGCFVIPQIYFSPAVILESVVLILFSYSA